jgi:hypothetical protein
VRQADDQEGGQEAEDVHFDTEEFPLDPEERR